MRLNFALVSLGLGSTLLSACQTAAIDDEGDSEDDFSHVDTTDAPSTEGETPECETEQDCGLYEICEAGVCVSNDGPDEDECTVDEDCDAGLVCLDLACVASLPTLTGCAALQPTATVVTTLAYPHAVAIADIDSQPGDEIVAYQQGSVVTIAHGSEPIVSPHMIPYGGVRDAVLLHADADPFADLWVATADGLRQFVGDGAGGFSYLGARYFEFELARLGKAEGPLVDAWIGREGEPNHDHRVFVDPLAEAPSLTIPSDTEPLTGDVDGDGIDELMFMTWDTLEIWGRVFETYELVTTIDCAVEGFSGAGAAIGDLDDDGLDDVICMVAPSSSPGLALTVWSSLGGFEFAAQPSVFADGWGLEVAGRPTGVVANVTGDARGELVFETGSFVALGDGLDFTFACHGPLGLAGELEVGDLDGDGRDELVTVDADEGLTAHAFE